MKILNVIDVLLVFAVLCVLPFAWILRDGLGPDSVTTTGMTAISRTFMTFFIGPTILLLGSVDLLLRIFGKKENPPSPKATVIGVITAIALLSALSILFAASMSW